MMATSDMCSKLNRSSCHRPRGSSEANKPPFHQTRGGRMRKVLIAVDGSSRASLVFAAGAKAARTMDRHAVVYRSITVPPDFRPAGDHEPDLLPALIEREA